LKNSERLRQEERESGKVRKGKREKEKALERERQKICQKRKKMTENE